MKTLKRCRCLAALAVSSFLFPALAQDQKTIVFVAGPKDHGRIGKARHEYERDLTVLKHCVDNAGHKDVRR